jgi:hypothetical protein
MDEQLQFYLQLFFDLLFASLEFIRTFALLYAILLFHRCLTLTTIFVRHRWPGIRAKLENRGFCD